MNAHSIQAETEFYNGLYAERNDAVTAQVSDSTLTVTTRDGRTIIAPLTWFPWLESAAPELRQDFTVWGTSIHWNQLDDGVSMATLLLGRYGT